MLRRCARAHKQRMHMSMQNGKMGRWGGGNGGGKGGVVGEREIEKREGEGGRDMRHGEGMLQAGSWKGREVSPTHGRSSFPMLLNQQCLPTLPFWAGNVCMLHTHGRTGMSPVSTMSQPATVTSFTVCLHLHHTVRKFLSTMHCLSVCSRRHFHGDEKGTTIPCMSQSPTMNVTPRHHRHHWEKVTGSVVLFLPLHHHIFRTVWSHVFLS